MGDASDSGGSRTWDESSLEKLNVVVVPRNANAKVRYDNDDFNASAKESSSRQQDLAAIRVVQNEEFQLQQMDGSEFMSGLVCSNNSFRSLPVDYDDDMSFSDVDSDCWSLPILDRLEQDDYSSTSTSGFYSSKTGFSSSYTPSESFPPSSSISSLSSENHNDYTQSKAYLESKQRLDKLEELLRTQPERTKNLRSGSSEHSKKKKKQLFDLACLMSQAIDLKSADSEKESSSSKTTISQRSKRSSRARSSKSPTITMLPTQGQAEHLYRRRKKKKKGSSKSYKSRSGSSKAVSNAKLDVIKEPTEDDEATPFLDNATTSSELS